MLLAIVSWKIRMIDGIYLLRIQSLYPGKTKRTMKRILCLGWINLEAMLGNSWKQRLKSKICKTKTKWRDLRKNNKINRQVFFLQYLIIRVAFLDHYLRAKVIAKAKRSKIRNLIHLVFIIIQINHNPKNFSILIHQTKMQTQTQMIKNLLMNRIKSHYFQKFQVIITKQTNHYSVLTISLNNQFIRVVAKINFHLTILTNKIKVKQLDLFQACFSKQRNLPQFLARSLKSQVWCHLNQ